MNPRLVLGWLGLNIIGAVLAAVVRGRDANRDASDRRSDSLWKKYGTYFAITGAVLYIGSRMPSAFKYAIYGLGWTMRNELDSGLKDQRAETRKLVAPIGYAFILAGLVGAWAIKQIDLTGDAWGWFWLVVATNDGYAQLFGQGWGETKLAARLSPGKTWEGFVAGTLSAVVAGLLLSPLLYPAGFMTVGFVALLTALAATGGDLLESWMKRVLGIKDFSSILGSHGGVLDRFDSLLGAAPVFAFLLWKIG